MSGRGRVAGVCFVAAVVLGCLPAVAHADVTSATDGDPSNQLWDCSARHVPFGTTSEDVLRCLTFHFDAPNEVRSAVLYLDIDAPTNSLQDTDSLVIAVDQPFDDCSWAQGAMAGCVIVHGGFQGGERSLVVDLLNVACDAAAPPIDAPRQQALRDAIDSGVLQVMLQDDTAVNGAWLDINGDPAPTCGTSTEAVPTALRTARPGAIGGDTGGGSTTPVVVAAAVAIVVIAGVLATAQQTRIRRARKQVRVERVPDNGRVEVEPSTSPNVAPSIAVGVTAWRDDVGAQTLAEANQ